MTKTKSKSEVVKTETKSKEKNEEVDYKKMFTKLIDLQISHCIKASDIFVKHSCTTVDLLNKQQNYLLEHEPIFFKKKWQKEVDEIDDLLIKEYKKMEKEMKNIEDCYRAIGRLN